jgi:alpha-beta hydrolase superfamily lysophospholipase
LCSLIKGLRRLGSLSSSSKVMALWCERLWPGRQTPLRSFVVHDYFGISDATKEAVERLGALGYRTMAVDLYGGKSASKHEEAVALMQSLDPKLTDEVLQTGLDVLKKPERKIATLGFSMGG